MTSINEDQIDLITGEHLGSMDMSPWDDRMAHLLDPENDSDSEFHLETDDDSSEDYRSITSTAPKESSNSKKRKSVRQHTVASGGSRGMFSEWDETFREYTNSLELLLDACRRSSSMPAESHRDLKKDCMQMIRELKQIPRHVWENTRWRERLRESGFLEAFWRLEYVHVDPKFDIPPLLLPLWRQCQIYNTICVLLIMYYRAELPDQIPSDIPKLWPDCNLPEGEFSFCYSKGPDIGEKLVRVLLEFPDVIPLHTNPSSVFFLSSKENFQEAYDDWLRCALVLRGVQVCFCPF
jgi:hypothetical protein